jgi:transcriptional regulator with XRE-family HTH domain
MCARLHTVSAQKLAETLTELTRGPEAREETLHCFVRERRMRIAPDSHFLGESPRLPIRVGKRVTQEELAEHLGISRGWYARFEAGAPAAFSIALLRRLGDLLLLVQSERAELVRLAMPELEPVLSGDSSSLYDAVRGVRNAVKRLWAATSEAEIFHVAGEEARRLLPHSELIWVQRELQTEALFPHPGWHSATRLAEARADALRRLTPEQIARLDALWQPTPAGEILPFEAYPRDIVRQIYLSLREHGLAGNSLSLVAAHIQGSSGFSGGLMSSSTRPHEMTKLDGTMLSAIADFASMSLR